MSFLSKFSSLLFHYTLWHIILINCDTVSPFTIEMLDKIKEKGIDLM